MLLQGWASQGARRRPQLHQPAHPHAASQHPGAAGGQAPPNPVSGLISAPAHVLVVPSAKQSILSHSRAPQSHVPVNSPPHRGAREEMGGAPSTALRGLTSQPPCAYRLGAWGPKAAAPPTAPRAAMLTGRASWALWEALDEPCPTKRVRWSSLDHFPFHVCVSACRYSSHRNPATLEGHTRRSSRPHGGHPCPLSRPTRDTTHHAKQGEGALGEQGLPAEKPLSRWQEHRAWPPNQAGTRAGTRSPWTARNFTSPRTPGQARSR